MDPRLMGALRCLVAKDAALVQRMSIEALCDSSHQVDAAIDAAATRTAMGEPRGGEAAPFEFERAM